MIKKYILFSDDVRNEENGKLMVIGLLGAAIVPEKLPLTMPFAVTAAISVEGTGDGRITGTLRHVDSGTEVLSFEARGTIGHETDILIPFKFSRVRFEKPGLYEILLKPEGQEEGLRESFRVAEPAADKIQAISLA